MELRHLRYFVGVAEALNFTKAAEKLHTAQPSLTRQIKDLEDETGVRLLNRTKQQVTLTDEGRSFLADAKRILALVTKTVESARKFHSGEVRALNIGYVSNLFYNLLPKTLVSFHQAFPTVAGGLGVALVPEQLRRLEHNNVVFRLFKPPTVATEGCVAWRSEHLPDALRAYVQIVEQVGRSLR